MWTVEFLFNTVLALKERGLLPDSVMRATGPHHVRVLGQDLECGGDTEKQAYFKKKYFEASPAPARPIRPTPTSSTTRCRRDSSNSCSARV